MRIVTKVKWNTSICTSCCPKRNAVFLKDVLDRRYPNATLVVILEAIKNTESLGEAEIYLEKNYNLHKRLS